VEAWKRYAEVEYQLLALGLPLPASAPLQMKFKGMVDVTGLAAKAGGPPNKPSIQVASSRAKYQVGDTLLLRLIRVDEKTPLQTITWNVLSEEKPADKDKPATFHSYRDAQLTTSLVFSKSGQWTIVVLGADGVELARRTVQIDPSGLVKLYRDKRLHEFNRQLVAGLLALIGGIVANRAFGFTFGSFEEYLLAFTWGVGVSYGVSQFSPGYDALKRAVEKLKPLNPKTTSTSNPNT
jgi:hypothetical protein